MALCRFTVFTVALKLLLGSRLMPRSQMVLRGIETSIGILRMCVSRIIQRVIETSAVETTGVLRAQVSPGRVVDVALKQPRKKGWRTELTRETPDAALRGIATRSFLWH